MKFDRPDDDYYRREIGRKLERACLFDSDIEDPSPETVKMWMEKAKELREKRRRRKRLLISSAAVFVLSVGIGATIAFEQPSAEAGNSGEVRIETGMESKDTYASVDEVPDSVKEEFLMFPEMPEGYELEEITLKKESIYEKLNLVYVNQNQGSLVIEEVKYPDEYNNSQVIREGAEMEVWSEYDVYYKAYSSGAKETVYKFFYDSNILVNINANKNLEKSMIKKMVERAVRE